MENNTCRDQVKQSIACACEKYPQWMSLPQDTREALIRRMERSCFNCTIESCVLDGVDRLFTDNKFLCRYSTICYRVISNLEIADDGGGNHLLAMILSDHSTCVGVGCMTSQEMCPAAGATERAEIELRQQQKIIDKVSHAYVCGKCHKNETQPIEYQSSCSDESSSFSVKCINCGHIWRR